MEKEFAKLDSDKPEIKFLEAISPQHSMYQKYIKMPGKIDTSFGNGPRCFCVDDGEAGADRKKCMHRRRKMKSSEIAICLSHYSVYLDMLRENLSWIMVCEDDIRFSDGFSDVMDRVIGDGHGSGHGKKNKRRIGDDRIWVSGEPVMVCLGGRNQPGELGRGNFRIERSQKAIYSNYCYLLNYAAAQLLVDHFWPITRPEDSYKRWLSNRGLLVSYVMRPSMIQELSAGINSARPIFHRLSKASNLSMIPEMRGSQESALGVEVKGGIRMLKKGERGSKGGEKKKKERILITTGRFGRRKSKMG